MRCQAVVVVLSREFVRKRHAMEMLSLVLECKRRKRDGCHLLPVLCDITLEQCMELPFGYNSEDWVGGEARPAAGVLLRWSDSVKRLLEFAAPCDPVADCRHDVRTAQAPLQALARTPANFSSLHSAYVLAPCFAATPAAATAAGLCLTNAPSQGDSDTATHLWWRSLPPDLGAMCAARNAAVKLLKAAGKLPRAFQPRSQFQVPMQVDRSAQPLIGRATAVRHAMRSLEERGTALIWGCPGEGKSAVAREVVCRLWDAGKCPGGCFAVVTYGA